MTSFVDRETQYELVSILLGIPRINQLGAHQRDFLLEGLPRNAVLALKRDDHPRVDLMTMVGEVAGWGLLDNGEWAIFILVQNALGLAQGTQQGRELESMLKKLKAAAPGVKIHRVQDQLRKHSIVDSAITTALEVEHQAMTGRLDHCEMLHYTNLEIKVEEREADNEFLATVLHSPVHRPASVAFQIDLAHVKEQTESVGNLFAKNAESSREERIDRQMRETGELLFQAAIFKGEVLDSYRDSLHWAEQHGEGLCIRLDVCPKLIALPWEFMYDAESEGGRFLCSNRQTPIVRTFGTSLQFEEELNKRKWPLKMLIVPANPLYSRKLNSKGEIERIRKAVCGCRAIEIESIDDEANTWDTLVGRVFSGERIDILHFTMHGRPGVLTGVGQHRGKQQLTEDDLATIIGNILPRPLLVVVNACSAGLPNEEKKSVGLLPRLSRMRIPFVVGMQFEISDTAGNAFSEAFYAQLAKGHTVLNALTHARLRICKCYYPDMENSQEWGIPVLYLNGEDAALMSTDNSVSASDKTLILSNDVLKLKIEGLAYRKLLDVQERKGFGDPSDVLEAAVEFLEKTRGYRIKLVDKNARTREVVELRAIPAKLEANQATQTIKPCIDDNNADWMIVNYQGRAYGQLCALAKDLQVTNSPADVVMLALELYTATIGKEVYFEGCDGEVFRVQL